MISTFCYNIINEIIGERYYLQLIINREILTNYIKKFLKKTKFNILVRSVELLKYNLKYLKNEESDVIKDYQHYKRRADRALIHACASLLNVPIDIKHF